MENFIFPENNVSYRKDKNRFFTHREYIPKTELLVFIGFAHSSQRMILALAIISASDEDIPTKYIIVVHRAVSTMQKIPFQYCNYVWCHKV